MVPFPSSFPLWATPFLWWRKLCFADTSVYGSFCMCCFGRKKKRRVYVIMDQGRSNTADSVQDLSGSDNQTQSSNTDTTQSADLNHVTSPPLNSSGNIPRSISSVPLIHRDDWASDLPDTLHIQFFRETNWANTRLGPLSTWGIALRLHTLTVMADSQAGCIYW